MYRKIVFLIIALLSFSHLSFSSEILPPLEGRLARPFTEDESIDSGFWKKGSRDLPYFGAPRNPRGRQHAGVDLYPAEGVGAPVYSMLDGRVLKVAPFYNRRNGERTYGVLVDHGIFVANYGEVSPLRKSGEILRQGDLLGRVSGTAQLHLELYAPGIKNWIGGWYGKKPEWLLDPTEMILDAMKGRR